MKTIVVSEFHQETNSFNPLPTTRADFERRQWSVGKAMLETGQKLELGGLLRAIAEGQGRVIPGCAMKAMSGGPVAHEIAEEFLGRTLGAIRENAPVDGVFLSLHGATQTPVWEDACGVILEAVRNETGGGTAIVASADMHANVTRKWMDNANIVCGYRSYPHVDHFDTGYRAGKLGMMVLDGQELHMAMASVPMLVAASAYSTDASPFREVIEDAKQLTLSSVLQDCSVFQMQPWLDVSCASGAVVIAIDADRARAQTEAARLAKRLYEVRKDFRSELYTIDQVIDLALQQGSARPVLLVDSADSANAGSTGDSAAVLERLLQRADRPSTAMIVNDTAATVLAYQVGVGNRAEFVIGGGRNPALFNSVRTEAYVKSLHDGVFQLGGPAYRGVRVDIGHTAVLSVGQIEIVVCQAMMMNGDLQIYRGFGVEPSLHQLVVVKACTSFREAYGPISGRICPTDTPGAAGSDLRSLPFKRVPASFYPFSIAEDG